MKVWETRHGQFRGQAQEATEDSISRREAIMQKPWTKRVSFKPWMNPLFVCAEPGKDIVGDDSWETLKPINLHASFVLIEYAEQSPLVRCQAGMSSAIIRMMRTEHGTGEASDEEPERGVLQLAWEDNTDPKFMWTEPSPLMMDPDPNETVIFLHNWVMNVPLFPQHVPHSDFLLFPGTGDVCAIDHEYLAGQVEPRILVMPPTEYIRGGTLALQRYVELTYCWEAFRSRDTRLPESWTSQRFKGVHPRIVQDALRRVAEAEDSWYVPKAESSQSPRHALKERLGNLTMFTTYESCGWDAMERGLGRLRRAGIGNGLVDAEVREVLNAYQMQLRILRLSYYAGKAVGTPGLAGLLAKQKREIAAAKYISREIMRTPWYLSLCFDKLFNNIEAVYNPFPSGTVMQVTGRADPSGRGDMVNFLPDYRKADLGKKYDSKGAQVTEDRGGRVFKATSPGEEDDIFFECEVYDEEFRPGPQHRKKTNTLYQANEKVKLFGTDADLRKVNIEDLQDMLMNIGIPEKEVIKIPRWDCTWLIDQVASSHLGKTILDGAIAKYSRVHRMDDGNIPEEVRVRWQLEASSEFRNARARATEAYRKFARFAGMDEFGRKKAWRYRLADEMDRILSEQEDERLDYEEFIAEQANKNAAQSDPVRGPADENELLSWAAAQPAITGRRLLMRTFIKRMDDGREHIWVEYYLNHEDVEDYENKRKVRESGYMERERNECEWEEIEEGEDEYVI
jgi:hypothetical protein